MTLLHPKPPTTKGGNGGQGTMRSQNLAVKTGMTWVAAEEVMTVAQDRVRRHDGIVRACPSYIPPFTDSLREDFHAFR